MRERPATMGVARPMKRPTLPTVLTWAGLLVSLLFTYLAFRGIDFGALRRALLESEYWMLGPALLILAIAIFLRAVRWRILFSPAARPPLGIVTNALIIGYFFNTVLPARAGEAARVLALRQRAGTPRFEGLGTVVAERALDVLALLILLFAVARSLPDAAWLPSALVLGAIMFVAIAVAFVAFALFGERPARILLRPLALFPRMSKERRDLAAANLVLGFAVFRRPSIAVPAFALTFLSWLLIAVAFWLCMDGFDLGLGLAAGIFVVVAVNLALIVPSGPAGIGVFEAATLVALLPYDVDRSSALSYALVLHAINSVPFIVFGYVALHYHTVAVRRQRPDVSVAELGGRPDERTAPLR
jgi:glycosyltransferase 2 family protein